MEGLRRRCQRRLRGPRVPHPFDLDLFSAQVAARRGRPRHRHPLPGLREAPRRHAAGAAASEPRTWAPVGPEMADEVAWLPRVSAAFRRLGRTGPDRARPPRPAGPPR
ncbi:hypothetical protein Ate01nite_46680 [Actinoplanes teichomyceticus]|nr:hypothetical protein Ate01nite_46680 [Actinoplanes teichomyceticus]